MWIILTTLISDTIHISSFFDVKTNNKQRLEKGLGIKYTQLQNKHIQLLTPNVISLFFILQIVHKYSHLSSSNNQDQFKICLHSW